MLRRVGRGLGLRGGTGPDDTPWLRMERHESRVEGYAEGRAEGERSLLLRQAERRFGAGTAERLAVLLSRPGDPDRLAGAGDSIVDCSTGAELLARVEALGSRG